MYETKHSDGRKGKINYTVWSDVFVCPECTSEIVFWDAAVDKETWQVNDDLDVRYVGHSLERGILNDHGFRTLTKMLVKFQSSPNRSLF
ncbi:MAG: hypothetical protein R2932_24195 [Caldilineaceae bacterium]